MNAAELYEATLAALMPDGSPENLLGINSDSLPSTAIISNGILPGFFQQALYDLQIVPCYRFNHHTKYPHCASYFNCGMTVIPKPQGKIVEIYTTDRLDPETGLEDATADDEHCAKVHYEFVEHCFIGRYVKLCQQESASSPVLDTLANLLFGAYRSKSRYPRPTDEGLAGLPTLPDGFHYPQTSTDAEGRSPRGVYSFSGSQIWIAPWIQSTETLHVRWNGIQRRFGEADSVEDDPKFAQAVRLHMGHQFHSCYGDSAKADDFKDQLYGNRNRGIVGTIPTLMDECAEEMLAVRCGSAGPGSGAIGGAARGLGDQATAYYNDTQFENTAHCPTGKTGGPFRVVKEIGSVPSAFSISDANARASQQAQDEAVAKLSLCVTTAAAYWNTAQLGSASCPGASADGLTPAASGPSVTFTEPANLHSSPDSQAAADALAKAAAEATAQGMLTCTFHNRAQTRTAVCPTGTIGDEQESTVAAGQPEHNSTVSQADADSKAGIAAQNAATALLDCGSDTFMVYNLAQSAFADGLCRVCTGRASTQTCRQIPIRAFGSVPAGTIGNLATTATAGVITGQLNAQALAIAQANAQASLPQLCRGMGGTLT